MPLCSVNQGYCWNESKSGHLTQFTNNNSEQVASHKNYTGAKFKEKPLVLSMANTSENFMN